MTAEEHLAWLRHFRDSYIKLGVHLACYSKNSDQTETLTKLEELRSCLRKKDWRKDCCHIFKKVHLTEGKVVLTTFV